MKHLFILLITAFTLTTSCTVKKSIDNKFAAQKVALKTSKWILLNDNNTFKNFKQDEVYFQFNEAGDTVNGNSSCNAFSANQSSIDDAGNISFGMISATKKYCPDIKIEKTLFSLLKESNKYEITNEKLYLYKDGLILLTFKQALK